MHCCWRKCIGRYDGRLCPDGLWFERESFGRVSVRSPERTNARLVVTLNERSNDMEFERTDVRLVVSPDERTSERTSG